MAEVKSQFKITWHDKGLEPQCPSNPKFPNGIDIDLSVYCIEGWPSCMIDLPYPAKRCGLYMVECTYCGFTVGITTAGRPDDPRSVKMGCKRRDPKELH